MTILRGYVRDKKAYEMQEHCATLSVMSAELGLNCLNCCFTIVQEIIDILINLLGQLPSDQQQQQQSTCRLSSLLAAVDEKDEVESVASSVGELVSFDNMYVQHTVSFEILYTQYWCRMYVRYTHYSPSVSARGH